MATLKPSSASVGSEVSKELAVVLAQRGSLARIVALVANERLLHIVYKPTENRPCPTREDTDYITWGQSIVEANGHPLHKSRMSVDPRTQQSSSFDLKRTEITFMAVKRHILEARGPLKAELAPLLAVTGIDGAASAVDSSEIAIPVPKFQIKFLLSRPRSKSNLRRK